MDGSAFSNLEANSFTKLCYSIDDSAVLLIPPGYACPFNLQMQDFLSFSVLVLESENTALYRLQVALQSTFDPGSDSEPPRHWLCCHSKQCVKTVSLTTLLIDLQLPW